MPLHPFEKRDQRDRDDDRCGQRQKELRTGPQCERNGQHQADARDQRQRREQPIAPAIYLGSVAWLHDMPFPLDTRLSFEPLRGCVKSESTAR